LDALVGCLRFLGRAVATYHFERFAVRVRHILRRRRLEFLGGAVLSVVCAPSVLQLWTAPVGRWLLTRALTPPGADSIGATVSWNACHGVRPWVR